MTIGRIPSVEGGIQPTIVDAKGDLIAGVAADSVNRLAVGTNGTVLTADSSTSTGLTWTGVNQMANPVINGGMDVWQRGTAGVAGTSTGAYFADRFSIARSVAGSTGTRQSTSDTTNLPNIQYSARIARDSGNTSTNAIYIAQSIESINSIPYAGKTITFSFYARKGANFSAASDALSIILATGTGTDQNILNGFTGSSSAISQTATLTSTWQRFAFSATLSSSLTQIGFYAFYTPVGTAGANDWFEITGFQIDLGTYTASSAPTFRRSGGTLAGELAACQRYYQKSFAQGTAPANDTTGPTAGGMSGWIAYTANDVRSPFIVFPVTMRTSASVTLYNTTDITDDGYWAYYSGSAWGKAASALGQQSVTASESGFYVSCNNVGTYTQHRPYLLAGNWAASAEL